jgi:1-aminocyclopropane-1-carboxylate deaminase/D-cysteine desulfhydrase-like pyridoxal-dependent ACC family enzyme
MSNTKKRGRKPKIIQIHGKDESSLPSNVTSSLDEILGERLSIYTAKNSEEYRRHLAEMNMTDLQAHAYKIGLIPTQDRKVLSDRLVNEFIKWSSRFQSPDSNVNIQSITELDNKAQKILREGA